MDYSINNVYQLMLKIQELTEELEIADEVLESIFENDENILLEEEKKKWIQNAIEKEGSLRKTMKTKEGKNIPVSKLEKAAKKGGKTGKRARLALTLRKLNKKKD